MISRVPRPWVRKLPAQRTITTIRLANPIRYAMWMPEPQQPGGEAALPAERAQPRDVRHAREPADDRDVAVVAVPERLVRPTEHAAPDRRRPRRCRPGCRPGRRPASAARPSTAAPRHRRPRRSRGGRARSGPGSTRTRPLRSVSAPVASATRRANEDASTPAAHSTVRAGMTSSGAPSPACVATTRTDRSSMSVTRVPVPDRHAEPLELALRRRGAIGRVGRQDPIHRLDEDDPWRRPG